MARPVDLLRLSIGAVALGAPGRVLPAEADTRWTRTFTRILGARYVAQSACGLVEPRPWVPAADAAVDLVHASTMVALAAISPRHRRTAVVSAVAAVAFAALDLREGPGEGSEG